MSLFLSDTKDKRLVAIRLLWRKIKKSIQSKDYLYKKDRLWLQRF